MLTRNNLATARPEPDAAGGEEAVNGLSGDARPRYQSSDGDEGAKQNEACAAVGFYVSPAPLSHASGVRHVERVRRMRAVSGAIAAPEGQIYPSLYVPASICRHRKPTARCTGPPAAEAARHYRTIALTCTLARMPNDITLPHHAEKKTPNTATFFHTPLGICSVCRGETNSRRRTKARLQGQTLLRGQRMQPAYTVSSTVAAAAAAVAAAAVAAAAVTEVVVAVVCTAMAEAEDQEGVEERHRRRSL